MSAQDRVYTYSHIVALASPWTRIAQTTPRNAKLDREELVWHAFFEVFSDEYYFVPSRLFGCQPNLRMKQNLRLSSLTYVLFVSLAAIDKGLASQVTFDDFYRGLDAGTLFDDIQTKLGHDIDLSLLTSQPDQKKPFLEMLESARAALEGRERRKTGIERSGLVLLCSYITEIIQQYGWDTKHDRPRMDQETY